MRLKATPQSAPRHSAKLKIPGLREPTPPPLTGKNAVTVLATTLVAIWLQNLGGLLGSGGLSGLSGLALPVLFFVALYFLMIVPNQKKQKAWTQMLNDLKSGDRVTTNGGLRGTVLQVKEDVVIVRVQPDNIKLEFVKSAIAAVTTEETKTV